MLSRWLESHRKPSYHIVAVHRWWTTPRLTVPLCYGGAIEGKYELIEEQEYQKSVAP